MNFILTEMTFLRYFMPLIIAGNKRNIKSTVYYHNSGKYNCPNKNIDSLKALSQKYKFNLIKIQNTNLKGTTFFVEGVGAKDITSDQKISFTYMTDYQLMHKKYWDQIDYCVFPSKIFSQVIDRENNNKSLHFGSPKYDVQFDLDNLSNQYKLGKKNALFMFPKLEDVSKSKIDSILKNLCDFEYNIYIKTRGKDPINSKEYPNVKVIHDGEWHPHPSIDLSFACDLMINFDSTAVKEASIFNMPTINYNVKGKDRGFYGRLPFLLNENFIFHAESGDISQILEKIETTNFTSDFEQARKKYFFDRENVCDQILSLV